QNTPTLLLMRWMRLWLPSPIQRRKSCFFGVELGQEFCWEFGNHYDHQVVEFPVHIRTPGACRFDLFQGGLVVLVWDDERFSVKHLALITESYIRGFDPIIGLEGLPNFLDERVGLFRIGCGGPGVNGTGNAVAQIVDAVVENI